MFTLHVPPLHREIRRCIPLFGTTLRLIPWSSSPTQSLLLIDLQLLPNFYRFQHSLLLLAANWILHDAFQSLALRPRRSCSNDVAGYWSWFVAKLFSHKKSITLTTESTGPAAIQSNPKAVSYQAVLPPSSFNKAIRTNITGSVIATSVAGGSGVTIKVNYASLPDVATYGPFSK